MCKSWDSSPPRARVKKLITWAQTGSGDMPADRLRRLVDAGMLTKSDEPAHEQKAIYSLTERSISLVPVLAHLAA